MKSAALSLLQSRKFWLTTLTICTSIAMYLRHAITADQLANVLTASSAVLVLAISHEDRGAPQTIAAGGDVTVTPVAPKAPDSGDVDNLASGARPAEQTDPAIVVTIPESPKGQS